MLPIQATDLLEGFVRAFDSEHSPQSVVSKAYMKASNGLADPATARHGNLRLINPLAEDLASCLDRRASFIWTKLKEVITATEIEPYPGLASDLKSQVLTHSKPLRDSADSLVSSMRPLGVHGQALRLARKKERDKASSDR
jgi:hypothetical protein